MAEYKSKQKYNYAEEPFSIDNLTDDVLVVPVASAFKITRIGA